MNRLLACALLLSLPTLALSQKLPDERAFGAPIEVVAALDGPIFTGVTVSSDGRVFVNFPQWGDKPAFTVAEIKNGKALPYPSAELNKSDPARPAETLVSVQSIVVDPTGKRLWMLDTGRFEFGPHAPKAAKLVGVDLATNKVFKTISFPDDVALPNTYLNDIRFDLRRGKEGTAFITDSGVGGIIVVDLASGKSWRRLQGHISVKADHDYVMVVEGKVTLHYSPGQRPFYHQVDSDGIAISPDAKWLYYCPMTGRKMYRASIDTLADLSKSEADVEKTVEDLGDKGGASDGLESDAQGRIYMSDYEHSSIHRRNADGSIDTLAHDTRMLWPDTLALATNGYLYFTANQLHRLPEFQKDGSDPRQRTFVVYRIKTDGTPITQ